MLDSLQHIAATLKKARMQQGLSQRALSAKTRIPQGASIQN